MDSTDDKRTVNNVMRHEYRVLSDKEELMMKQIKDEGFIFINMIGNMPKSREASLAITKIEEAVMWAIKGLTQ